MELSENKKELLGHWVINHDDEASRDALGNVLLKFGSDGILTYTEFEEDVERVMILVYEIINDEIITTQPNAAYQKETTKFYISEGNLFLNFNGTRSRFIRLPE
ncbi:MAG: hypothetical protein SH818_05865 [Saprospiraceae bacterium]|nr:hypothetical protein [Saprospiraceae bacterium]